ncbi:MAG: ATP-binding cassette domain-containing protein [Verrucomicrobia bacterium]|nr:ATP-binding cassette domain-containing protein [Verrucomicrobiota bacterium]
MNQKTQPLIEMHGCAFGYGGRAIVEDVNLAVGQGDFAAVLGPNGGGKTTLLRGLLGVLKPLRGEMRRANADGRPLAFGYVPQREGLDPVWPVSAMEMTLMGAYRRARWRMGLPLPRAEHERAVSCLARVGAEALQHKLFSEMSGGQKQRVLVARALMTQPDVLVLDEPASGFDVAAQQDLLELLRDMHQKENLTVLMVSHHFHGLQSLVNTVTWVHDGHVESGPAETMLAPAKVQEVFFP